jgi:hypothetical protein
MTTPETTPEPTGASTAQTRAAVKSSEDYFNSSRLKVIGLITAATVAVGALGGIAGVAFDPAPITKDNVIQPGGDGGLRLAPQALGGAGNASPYSGGSGALSPFTSRVAARVPGSDATSIPSPLGTVSPGTGGLTGGPSDPGTDEPTGGASGSTDGTGVTLEATGVDVYVPPNWNVDFQDENRVNESDGEGSFAFAFSYADDPATAAGDVITQNLENLLPAESYTQQQTSDVVPLDPFGSVVSMAGIEYEALWVDNQGSISIHGQIYVGVRQDGTVLGVLVEHVPAEDFESAFDAMTPILDNSFNRFAGLDG